MKLPALNELQKYREMIDAFGGYNHNLRIGNGEFYDMKNLTSDHYPILSPRKQRGIYASPEKPLGMISKDALCYVDGKEFIINDRKINLDLSDKPKTLLSMGAYVIIMPDKKYINTANLEDHGNIEAYANTTEEVKFSLCKVDGTEYEDTIAQDEAPENPENMDLWIDTSSTPNTLKQYSTTNAMWTAIPTTYVKIYSLNIGLHFKVGDGVTITGIEIQDLKDLNGTMVVWDRGLNYIVVTGVLNKVQTQKASITVARTMPNMDFVIESGNRLWGCRYGTDINGNVVNELYASKLGDFKNWNCFAGISTDSYAATVGTDGQFTGAITYLGYPIFFKENCMHKVYGNFPANYQIQTTACRGVQNGCAKSLAIVNEVLYYKARSSVCAYDGSLPVEISSALGDVTYGDAVAGVLGNKYYISMKDTNGIYSLFVYDTKKGMWHREDDTQATEICNCRGDLYFIDYAYKQIKTVQGTGTLDTKGVEWEAETGVIGTDSPDKKYISQMDVRMMLSLGSEISFFAEYDSCGEWEHLFSMTGTALRSFSVPIRPKRCDHLRLRIAGSGDAKIYSICKTIEQGSEI